MSAVGPGTTSATGMVRTPGSFANSASDGKGLAREILPGKTSPGDRGKTKVLALFWFAPTTNRYFPSPVHLSHSGAWRCVKIGAPPVTGKIISPIADTLIKSHLWLGYTPKRFTTGNSAAFRSPVPSSRTLYRK